MTEQSQDLTVEELASVMGERRVRPESEDGAGSEPEKANAEEPEAEEEQVAQDDDSDGGAEAEAVTDTDEDSEPEGEEQEPKYTVKIDGKEFEVPVSELTKGYQLESDYRKKTAEIAEMRRSLEAEKEQIKEVKTIREQYAQELQLLLEINNRQPVAQERLNELLSSGKPEDAAEYIRAKAANEQWAMNKNAVEARLKQTQESISEEAMAQRNALLAEETKKLEAALPSLGTVEAKTNLINYGLSLGFSKEEIGSVADHRILVMLEKARMFDSLNETKKAKPLAPVPKVTKSKSASLTGSEQKAQFIKKTETEFSNTGSVESLAKLLSEKRKLGVHNNGTTNRNL